MQKIDVIVLPGGRLDTHNAAKYLGLSRSHLTRLRMDGTGPKFIKQNGGRVFYFVEDLDAWIKEFPRVSSTNELNQPAE